MIQYRKISKEEAEKIDPNLKHTHPSALFKDLIDLIRKIGSKKFLHGAGYNTERDAFVACLFTYAIRVYRKGECYIQQVGDPPDFELLCLTDRSTKDKPFDHANIEVLSIPRKADEAENKEEFVLQILQKTKLKKEYSIEKGTILLVFVEASCGPLVIDVFQEFYNKNKDLFENFGEIFVMHLVSVSKEGSFIYRIVSLTSGWSEEFNLLEEFKKGIAYPHPLLEKYGVVTEN